MSYSDTNIEIKSNRLPQAYNQMSAGAKSILREGAEDVKVRADSGKPAKVPSRIKSVKDGYSVEFGSAKVFWGHFWEFGTTFITAKPFATPAAESVFPGVRLKLNRLERFFR